MRDPSASDLSGAEGPPPGRLPPEPNERSTCSPEAVPTKTGESWSPGSPPDWQRPSHTASSSPSVIEGAESPGSPPQEIPRSSCPRPHFPGELGPSTSGGSTCYWPSSPREHESERPESLYSVDEERYGSLEIVSDRDPGFYSCLFLVEKASGGWRPVIELFPLNEFVRQTPFKMETSASVLMAVREGDFLVSVDLKDAYLQIPIHHSSRKWLRFVSDGTVHQFKVLCFGLSTASQVFTGLCNSIGLGSLARDSASQVLGRLAGSGLLGDQSQATRPRTALALSLPGDSVINKEKFDLTPSQSVEYLGMTIDTVAARAFPTLARVERFLSIVRRFRMNSDPPAQLWQVLLGHMSSLEKLVPHERLWMRSLQWHLKSHWSSEADPPRLPVPRSRQVNEDLSWWMVRDHILEGMTFRTLPLDLRLYLVASRSGWGAHLLDRSVSGLWSSQESTLHINLLEMKALFLALQSFQDIVTNHRATVMCDNSTVVTYVNKQGGTVSDSLCLLTGRLLLWTEFHNVQLEARHLPGQ